MNTYLDFIPIEVLILIIVKFKNLISLKTLIKFNNNYINLNWTYITKLRFPKNYTNIINLLNNKVEYNYYLFINIMNKQPITYYLSYSTLINKINLSNLNLDVLSEYIGNFTNCWNLQLNN